jgi:16S rRNA (guanine527-N7)-methyltransferase
VESQESRFEYPDLIQVQCSKFETFARLLREHNQRCNLTAITETTAIYSRHFADSLAALPVLDDCLRKVAAKYPAGSLADIGSGAGLPGLALAIARPNWTITSIEATGKKVRFQREVIRHLGLENAAAVEGRAEELAHDDTYRECFDIVTARAVAELRILIELGAGLLKPGGRLIAWKTAQGQEEILKAAATLEAMMMRPDSIVPYSRPGEEQKSTLNLIVLKKLACIDDCYPRSFAKIKSTPISPGRLSDTSPFI